MAVDTKKLSLSRVLNKAREIFTPIAQRTTPLAGAIGMAGRAVNTPLNVNLEPFRGAYNSVNRALKQPTGNFGQTIINTSNKLVNSPLGIPGRAVMGYGDALRQNITRAGQAYGQNTQLLNEGAPLRARIKPLAVGGWNTAKALSQVVPGGGVASVIPGTFSAGIAKVQGQDPARAFGTGLAEYQGWRPILNVTNPLTSKVASGAVRQITDKAVSRLGKLKGTELLASQLTQRGVSGLGNTIEDEILAKLDQTKRTNTDRLVSFGLGAAMSGNQELLNNTDFKKIGKQLGIKAEKVKEVYEGTLARRITITDDTGKTQVIDGLDKKGASEWSGWAQNMGYKWTLDLGNGSPGRIGDTPKPPTDPTEALKVDFLLPKDIPVHQEAKAIGAKRIAPDRIPHQQLTPDAGIKALVDKQKQRLQNNANSWLTATKKIDDLIKKYGEKLPQRTEKNIQTYPGLIDDHRTYQEYKKYAWQPKNLIDIKNQFERRANVTNAQWTPEAEAKAFESAKKDYIELIKSDISKGYKYPDSVLDFDRSFRIAENNRARYEKGLRTSFSSDDQRIVIEDIDKIGGGMKRQDGKPITDSQKETIKRGVVDFANTMGIDVSRLAKNDRWVYVHLNGKNPFLTAMAGGLYRKGANNVSISVGGSETFKKMVDGKEVFDRVHTTMAHELGHALDGKVDKRLFDSQTIWSLRNNFNPIEWMPRGDKYWKSQSEITARMIEQYNAVKKGNTNLFSREGYWKKDIYEQIIEPAVEKAINTHFADYKLQTPLEIPKSQLTDLYNQATKVDRTQLTGRVATQEPLGQIGKGQLEESQLSKQGKEVIKQVAESETSALSALDQGKLSNPNNPSLKVSVPKKKYSFNINKNKLSLGKKEQKALDGVIEVIKPELEKARGKTLSNKEVIESAKKSDILQKITTREETLNANAAMLKARQRIVELDKDITKLSNGGDPKLLEAKMRELVESLRVVSAEAVDRGRKLQSLSIQAEDESLRQAMLKEIGKVETDSEKIIKEAANVDWNDAKSVASFYRKFIKPSTTEILDEFRYNNMLSNPRTHIRNAYSNLLQTFITRPLTIAATGDIKGATQYYKGALSSFPDAVRAFTDSFSGKTPIDKPDMEQIPTLKLPSFLTIPSRAMEAGDKFFTTLIRSGELAKGSTTKQADDVASYSLFRQNTHPKGQGKLLEAIDNATDGVYQLGKKIPLMRWFVPFIRTPMNFAKQWVEYSPLGVATLPGASNKKEQLAKAFLGTTVTALGAYLATEGRTTWAAPTDKKEKDLFYASGRKPFSIKIGDKWVSMMYAGPFAMALALPAATKYYSDESKTSLTDSQLEKLVKITSSMGEFLSGQTFLEGLGNFVSLVKGDADYTLPKNIAYTAQQFIPLQGMVRYITTIVDPVYRKSSGMVEEVQKNIPFASKELEPYTTPSGSESIRESVNYFSPYDITTSQPQYDPMIEQRQYINKLNNNKNFLKKQATNGNFDAAVVAPDSVGGMYILDMIDARITAKDPSLTGQEIATYYESRIDKPKSTSVYESAVYENEVWDQVSNINSRESLTQQQKDDASIALLEKIGVTPQDYQYHTIAKQTNDLKSLYAEEEITKLMASGVSREEIDQWLIDNRKEVDGKQVLTSGVIDYLVDQNILSYSQGKELKAIKVTGSGSKRSVTRKSSKAKKPKKISFKAIKPPKVKIVKSTPSSYFKAPKVKRVAIKKAKKLKFR